MEPSPHNSCNVPDCTESMTYLPFKCKYCGLIFCKVHRLPENHSCSFVNQVRVSNHAQTSIKSKSEIPLPKGNDISTSSSLYKDSPGEGFDNQLDREMRNYIRRQERTAMPSPSSNRRAAGHRVPFVTRATKPIVTYWIMGITLFLSVLAIVFGFYPYLLIYTPELFRAFFLPIITASFTTRDLFALLFAMLIMYGTGKSIELQYGPKFLLALYVMGGLLGTIGVIFIQALGMIFSPTLSFLYVNSGYTSTNWAAFMGIFAFIVYLVGLDREMRVALMFIPVQMKGKYLLYGLIGINALIVIGGMISGLLGVEGGGAMVASSFGQLCGIYAGKYFYDKFGRRTLYRWT